MPDYVDISDEEGLEENARYVFDQVIKSTHTVANDSEYPSFTLTDEIYAECQRFATATTCICYTPQFTDLNDVLNIGSARLMLISVLVGFQTYIKERGLINVVNDFTYPTDPETINKKWDETFEMFAQNQLDASNLAMVVGAYFYDKVLKQADLSSYEEQGRKFKKNKFDGLLIKAYFWGYNFAKAIIE